MEGFLLHVYKKGGTPFRSLSTLPDAEATSMMKAMYVAGSVYWERFEDPASYLSFRRQIEKRLRQDFIQKGGRPEEEHPVYFMLGRPKWVEAHGDPVTLATTDEIVVPLGILSEVDVSFTYPDSMVSAMMLEEKNPEYYEPDYHGKTFTYPEIMQVIRRKGLPGEEWQTKMPSHLAHYIEAQVWNRRILMEYLARVRR